MREWGTTPNGVFGAKLMWDHVGRLRRRAGEPLELFGDPALVWVRRRDVVRQAISLWRAMQTQWWRDDGARRAGEPRYSFAALNHLVGRLTEHDRCWSELLAGRPVLELTYEDVTADLPGAVRPHARPPRRGAARAGAGAARHAAPGGRVVGRMGGRLRS